MVESAARDQDGRATSPRTGRERPVYRLTAITWLYAVTTIIALVVTIMSARRRTTASGRYLVLMLLAITLWAGFGVLEVSATTVPLKILWSKFEYVGAVFAPVLLFLFVTSHELQRRQHSARTIVALCVLPVATLLIVFTNEWHSLVWTGFSEVSPATNLISYGHGLWFWVGYVGYSHMLITIATVLVVRQVILRPALYRTQAVLLLVAILFPWVASVVYVADLSPVQGLDLSRVALAITGTVMAAGVFKWQLLDLVPLARNVAIDRMADGLIVLDPEGRIIDMNTAAMRLLGLDGRVPFGSRLAEVAHDCPGLEQVTGPPQEGLLRCAGRWLEAAVSPVDERSHVAGGHVIVLHDITERIARQEELDLHRQHLERLVEERTQELERTLADLARTNLDLALANQAKDAFLTGMSHEMRTPLNTIIGFSDVLLQGMDGELTHAQRHHATLVNDAGKRLLGFVDEAFDAAHVLGGQVVPRPDRFDVGAAAEEVVDAARGAAADKGLDLVLHSALEHAGAVSDPALVRRVLATLIERALSVTTAGRVDVTVTRTQRGSRVDIADAGPPVPDEEIGLLFEPFGRMRTSAGLRPDAAGLSLAVAAALAAGLGGTIEAGAGAEGWTVLSFTFPDMDMDE